MSGNRGAALAPWWCLGMLLCFTARASAEEHPPVSLAIDACVPADADEVRRVLALELKGALLPRGSSEDDATQVTVGCEGELVKLVVNDALTTKTLSRPLELARKDQRVRARLLALSIVELVVASWSELVLEPPRGAEVRPEARPERRDAAVATVERFAPGLRRRRFLLGVTGLAGGHFGLGSASWGVGGYLAYLAPFDWEFALGFAQGRSTVARTLGDTQLTLWRGWVGAFHVGRFADDWSWRVGPSVSAGQAVLDPSTGNALVEAIQVEGAVVEASARLGVRWHVSSFSAHAGVRAGGVLLGPRGRVTEA